MRILLTGASGAVGERLDPYLRQQGHTVVRLMRNAPADDDPSRFAGPDDLTHLDTWPSWPAGIECVIHLGAANPAAASKITEATLDRVNVQGTAVLARRAEQEGVKRVVFVSTANVHAAAPDRVISERSRLAPQSPYAASKLRAEAAFWDTLDRTTGCVLRPVPVYGTHGRGNIARLIALARTPLPLPLKGLGAPRSLLSVDALCEAIERALTFGHGQTMLLADADALRPDQLVDILRASWGRRPALFRAPLPNIFPPRFVIDTRLALEKLGWTPKSTAEELARMARSGVFG